MSSHIYHDCTNARMGNRGTYIPMQYITSTERYCHQQSIIEQHRTVPYLVAWYDVNLNHDYMRSTRKKISMVEVVIFCCTLCLEEVINFLLNFIFSSYCFAVVVLQLNVHNDMVVIRRSRAVGLCSCKVILCNKCDCTHRQFNVVVMI